MSKYWQEIELQETSDGKPFVPATIHYHVDANVFIREVQPSTGLADVIREMEESNKSTFSREDVIEFLRKLKAIADLPLQVNDYWKKRCELVERMFDAMQGRKENYAALYSEWQQLKSQEPSPAVKDAKGDGWISADKPPSSMQPMNVVGKYGNKLITCPDTAYYKDGHWYDNSNDIQFVDDFIKYHKPLPTPPKQ